MPKFRDSERGSLVATWGSIVAAAVFEALTVPALEDKALWAASPWRADPYHTAASAAAFAAPMLGIAIVLRLLAHRALGGPDRARQTVRGAAAMTAITGVALAFEWVAVFRGAPFSRWGTSTRAQVAGLVLTSLVTVAATVLLARCRRRRGTPDQWHQDWLGDALFVCGRIPVLRHWAGPQTAEWVRRRAMTVFVVLSGLAAAAVTGAQAVGEHLTDPLFVSWMFVTVTLANLAFCVISNAVAGFIARPPRARARRIGEAATVAGGVAVLAAIAFHDPLWSALGTGPLTVPALAALTFGIGVAASMLTAGLLASRAVVGTAEGSST